MGFSTEQPDALWWLMVSPDVNAVRLILHLLEANEWRDDLPRILRVTLARQHRGAWDLTIANAWGALAVEKFSRAFETTPVTGLTTASLAGVTGSLDWTQAPKGKTLALPWPPTGEDLLVNHEGSGNPWINVETLAAIPLKAAFGSGYRITRTLTPIEQRQPGLWSRGDLLRVRLSVENATAGAISSGSPNRPIGLVALWRARSIASGSPRTRSVATSECSPTVSRITSPASPCR